MKEELKINLLVWNPVSIRLQKETPLQRCTCHGHQKYQI